MTEQVGTGSTFWNRRTNREPGCTCPSARYDPRRTKPTDPDCKQHGNN